MVSEEGRVIVGRLSHAKKAKFLNSVTVEGIFTDVRLLQSLKVEVPMEVIPLGSHAFFKLVSP